MKKAILLISVFLVLCIIHHADPQDDPQVKVFKTGNDLYGDLQNINMGESTYSVGAHMHVMGYVAGVHDSYNGGHFITPLNSQLQQLCLVVKKYLENHPEDLHYSAYILIVRAFEEAYPKKGTDRISTKGQ